MSLEGRVAIVTGGASGVGAATALTLADLGARVVLADIDERNGTSISDRICGGGGESIFILTDIADEASVASCVATATEAFGGIDILDNNAAALALQTQDGAVVDTSLDLLMQTLRINVGGPFLMCQEVIPSMIARGGGSIVNIVSIAALAGEMRLSAYGASKAAVIQLTRSIAVQYAHAGIRANSVAPSYVDTERNRAVVPEALRRAYLRQTPTGRLVSAQDVADVVAFLASDHARQITGHLIPVDGGLLTSSPIVADYRDA